MLILASNACNDQQSQSPVGDLLTDASEVARSADLHDTNRVDLPPADVRGEEVGKAEATHLADVPLELFTTDTQQTELTDLAADLLGEPDLTDIAADELDGPDLAETLSDEISELELVDLAADEFSEPETLDLVPEEVAEPPCEVTPIPTCPIHFFIETTYPALQTYVWLTGSFNDWATSPAEGAVPLELNQSETLWQVDLVVDDDLLVDYKFLMGWADNPGPNWVTQDWDFAENAPNSKVLVQCGETGCGTPAFIHRPRLQWPDQQGFWILAETDINVPLEYTVTWDSGNIVVESKPESPQIFWLDSPKQMPPGYQHRTFIALPAEVGEVTIQITSGPAWQQTVKRPHLAESFRLAIYGDTRSQPEPHQMVVDAVVAEAPDAVLVTGDMIDIAVHWNEWEEWAKIEEKILESAFWLPVYGNHDTIEGGKGRPYLETWFQTDNRYRSGGSYSLDLGIVGLAVLDTYSTDFTQEEGLVWLADTLAALQDKEWLFVAFHEPYYSYLGHPPWYPGLEFIDPVLQAYDVDIVFNGHDHAYEHFLVGETHYMIAGGGGAPLSDYVGPVPPELVPFHIMSGAFYHYVLLDITATSLTAKVVQLPEDVVVDELVLVK